MSPIKLKSVGPSAVIIGNKPSAILASLAVFFLILTSAPDAATDWTPLGSGLNGTVHALAVDSRGFIYAGGEFTVAGGSAANNIARWNGSGWTGLGTGINGPVYALAVDGQDNLYAGGDFTTAGGAAAQNIARWNGSSWSALGSGIEGIVYALAVSASNNLYAGGDFLLAGSVAAFRIARWNGSTWSALGNGMNTTVMALAADGLGNLYAGGTFSTAGGVTANRVARWNGSAWSALGSGISGLAVYALAVDTQNRLYAGGLFSSAGGIGAGNIARWNGSSWSALGSGMNNAVRALDVDEQGILYAGGLFSMTGGNNIAQYSLSAWSPLGSGVNNSVRALRVNAHRCLFAGGDFVTAGGTPANHAAGWFQNCQSASGTILINDGAAFSNNPAVVLALSGSQLALMRFSNDGLNWSVWEPFAAVKLWTLAAGAGIKTVFAQFADIQGSVSAAISDSIILDTIAPISQVSTPTLSCSRQFSVQWIGNDEGSGINSFDLQYRIGPGGNWQNWLSDVSTLSAVFGPAEPALVQPGFTYYFRVRARDQAGNLEAYPGGDGGASTRILDCPFDLYYPFVFKDFSETQQSPDPPEAD